MGKNFIKKFISLLKDNNMKVERKLTIEVPKNSTDHQIDDNLGNILLYKLNGQWIYDNTVSLPNEELEIVDLQTSEESIKIEIRYHR